METVVVTSECRSYLNLLLRELSLLGAMAADWHRLLSFITVTRKPAAFWEMSNVGPVSRVAGATSVEVQWDKKCSCLFLGGVGWGGGRGSAPVWSSHGRFLGYGDDSVSQALALGCCSPFVGHRLQMFVCDTGNSPYY